MIRKKANLLFFGILTAVFSSPGQTFLVSLFIPAMRESLGISASLMTALYSASTLLSGFLLPLTGRVFDRAHLLTFTAGAAVLLALGCLVLGMAGGPGAVFAGFFLIRNLGQGTLTLISSTCMARLFSTHQRGRALGISHLGYPLGEILFPSVILAWISTFGWRAGWFFQTGLILFFLVPSVYFLLRGDSHKKVQDEIAKAADAELAKTPQADRAVKNILKDMRFYFILVPVMTPPAVFTALFFHQPDLFREKGWDPSYIAAGFAVFGVMRAAVSLLAGRWVDRYTARRIFPWILIPMGAGLLCFWLGQSAFWGPVYLGLAGITMGMSGTVSSALFAEIYGVRRLGSIRGITSAGVIFTTAAAPLVFSYLLGNFSLAVIFLGLSAGVVIGSLSAIKGIQVP